jgi:hypothetical protein
MAPSYLEGSWVQLEFSQGVRGYYLLQGFTMFLDGVFDLRKEHI